MLRRAALEIGRVGWAARPMQAAGVARPGAVRQAPAVCGASAPRERAACMVCEGSRLFRQAPPAWREGGKGKAKEGGKGKGKDKADAGGGEPAEPVDTRAIMKEMDADCANALQAFQSELELLRTGRANPRILDKVRVEAYSATVSLEKVAQVTAADARTLTVNVFDPELVASVDKAVRGAGLDLNPQVAGSTLRVPIPKVTQEGRKKLTKQANSIGENAKVVIRRVRQSYMEKGKKMELPKDDAKRYEKDIQEVHDKAVKEVDAKVKAKSQELMDD